MKASTAQVSLSGICRVLPQTAVGGFFSFLILQSMSHVVTTTDLVALVFAMALLAGGVLVMMRKPTGNWLLLLGSLGVLAAGTFCHYLRIRFILENGGMEGPEGYGSPMAFLLGWASPTLLLFIPGLFFSIWNGWKIWNRKIQNQQSGHA